MTGAAAGAPIVVGVDGSEQSLRAIDVAVRAATDRRRPLRIVHAFLWPLVEAPLGPALGPAPLGPEPGLGIDGGLRRDAERVVAQAEAYARGRDSEVAISAEIIEGGPAAVLIAASRDAALLVVGHRGLGGFAGLLLGSVAVQVIAHAACPVLVARGSVRTEGPVVVGVDGSPNSAQAIAFAADEATWRGTSLLPVNAWTPPLGAIPTEGVPLVYDVERIEAQEQRVLVESIAGVAQSHPDLPVEPRLVRGPAGATLTELSGKAQLAVVGSRGRGGFLGLLLGSVSQALIHHANCPVAVVRPLPSNE